MLLTHFGLQTYRYFVQHSMLQCVLQRNWRQSFHSNSFLKTKECVCKRGFLGENVSFQMWCFSGEFGRVDDTIFTICIQYYFPSVSFFLCSQTKLPISCSTIRNSSHPRGEKMSNVLLRLLLKDTEHYSAQKPLVLESFYLK